MGPDIEFVGKVDDRSKSDLTDLNALVYLDYYILPHMDQPKFAAALAPVIERMKADGRDIRLLNDDEFIWINGDS